MIASQRQAVSITDIHTITDISGAAGGGSNGARAHLENLGKNVPAIATDARFLKVVKKKHRIDYVF